MLGFFDQYGSDEGAIYSHLGGTVSYHSAAVFQPKQQTGIVAVSNCVPLLGGSGNNIYEMTFALGDKLMRMKDDSKEGFQNMMRERLRDNTIGLH
jgi:hypothetical protein